MEQACQSLNIPKKQIKETKCPNKFCVIAAKSWLKNIVKYKRFSDFKIYPGIVDEWPSKKDLPKNWDIIFLVAYEKLNLKLIPLPKNKNENVEPELPLTYSQLIYYVQQNNHKNLWKLNYKKYGKAQKSEKVEGATSSKKFPENISQSLMPHELVLREVITRIYGCPIIHAKLDRLNEFTDEESGALEFGEHHLNLFPTLAAIETSTHFYLLQHPYIGTTLQDALTYSPAILDKSHNKPLFIIYQLLSLMKSIHERGLLLGDIELNDIYLNENLLLNVMPKLESNLIQYVEQTGETETKDEQSEERLPESLKDYCEMWCNGLLSNYDYLMELNSFAGRRENTPDYYPIMPWVTDFSTRQGNWRDLSKSKYRLNKGDAQLDLTFQQQPAANSLATTPHHVSDVLSEITYYVYFSRRTPKSTLCKHVRPRFVAAEYPASIQRLQEWSPDECIPEFFNDPTIFKSIHEDLPNLEVPAWSSSPEDFIMKHREALESQFVSENLHNWIDLTFGYKLKGRAAVKAKNVCLAMADNHKHLTTRGVVQLFDHPHPKKYFKSPWFGKLPPRIYNAETRKRMTRSSEDLSLEYYNGGTWELSSSPSTSNLSNNSSNQRLSCSPKPASRLPHQSESIERSTSYHTNVQKSPNLILLPKNYNPLAQLEAVESMEAFLSKTFKQQKPVKIPVKPDIPPLRDHLLLHNYNYYEAEPSNAFTNRIFLETYEASLAKDTKMQQNMRQKKFQHQSSKRNFKQILAGKRVREMQLLGCLIVEIFLARHLRPLLGNSPCFDERLDACQSILKNSSSKLPKCVQKVVKLLFGIQVDCMDADQIITDQGLPIPTAQQLFQPILSNLLVPFPGYFIQLMASVKAMEQFNATARLLSFFTFFECDGLNCQKYENLDKAKTSISRRLAECKVKACAVLIDGLLEPRGLEQFDVVELLLPFVIDLLENEETSILAAWYLFDNIASSLGIDQTKKLLLGPMLQLYDVQNDERMNFLNSNFDSSIRFTTSTSTFKNKKAVKLYHHSFLLKLIVRFGLQCFLENFISPLIEAVGGYKDPETECAKHFHEGSIKTSSKNLKYVNDGDDEEPITLVSPSGSNESDDKTISANVANLGPPEEMFVFDPEDGPQMDDVALMKIMDQFELKSETSSIDLRLNHSQADEITEDDPAAFHLNDFTVGGKIMHIFSPSSVVASTPSKHEETKQDLKSPTIAIPSSFKRSIQVNSIGCEIGSRKSTDSSDFLSNTPSEHFQRAADVRNLFKASEEKTQEPVKAPRSTRIAEMSSESLIWLSHRLGPVLSARYLTRNLLKMLTLCYVGQENLVPCSAEIVINNNVSLFTIANGRVLGDQMSQNVLDCLTSISAIFGEQFILSQYLPHVRELIALCRKKVTVTLEGGLISSLQLIKYLIPCLSDATIMDQLQDTLLRSIVHPIIRLLGSNTVVMPSGFLGRSVLARKLLDTIYVISIRIGSELSKEHLCVPALQRFFLIFDKAYGVGDGLRESTSEAQLSTDSSYEGTLLDWKGRGDNTSSLDEDANSMKLKEKGTEEIREVFIPNLAHSAYLPFLRHLGEFVMQQTVQNLPLVINLCHEHLDVPNYSSLERESKFESTSKLDTSNFMPDLQSNSFSSNVSIVGNRIDFQFDNEIKRPTTSADQMSASEVIDLVAYKLENFHASRQLKGNWLAYWQSEIGRADKDLHFNLKLMKLQTYSGHTNSIRQIHVIDNENSFMTASKDKTVKLWSLRNEGDGSKVQKCQFTYHNHKKSVHSLTFLESMRLAISCDSGVHLFDPFIGAQVGQLDGPKYTPVSVVKTFPSPSSLALAGTADSTVKLIDARIFNYILEWKILPQASGSVRCIAIAPSGTWIAVGIGSGYIYLLDARTGMIITSWKASEGELLQLLAPNDSELISSSLDHSISVWSAVNGALLYHLKNPPEPAHCLRMNGNELIIGTPANRIGVYNLSQLDLSGNSFTKLRSEVFKGVLTNFTLLPLNRLLLLGSDSGNVTLLC